MKLTNLYQLDNFLGIDINRQLLDLAISKELDFVDTTTTTNALDYRKSKVLYSFDDFRCQIEAKIRARVPTVLESLQLAPFEIATIEAQLTAHNHGHYYKIHNDNGSELTKNRVLTYVYYFHSHPLAFSGGQLQLGATRIEPHNDRVIFFPSGELHQVLPIDCPSRKFASGRFTVNGWIRQV